MNTVNLNFNCAWHMWPGAFEGLRLRSEGASAPANVKENGEVKPLAARPTVDNYGDPISQMQVFGKTAIIPVQGMLVKGASPSDKAWGGVAAHDDIASDLDAAAEDVTIKQALLYIQSPGGTVLGTEGLGKQVAAMAKKKAVYCFTDTMCCSAAEFISAGCTARFCTADAIVGSIGTLLITASLQGMLTKFGISVNVFASGKYKGMGSPYKDLTPEQSAYLQNYVDARGAEFKSFMTTYRPALKPASMEGQFFTGREGVKGGLYDGTAANLAEALQLIGS